MSSLTPYKGPAEPFGKDQHTPKVDNNETDPLFVDAPLGGGFSTHISSGIKYSPSKGLPAAVPNAEFNDDAGFDLGDAEDVDVCDGNLSGIHSPHPPTLPHLLAASATVTVPKYSRKKRGILNDEVTQFTVQRIHVNVKNKVIHTSPGIYLTTSGLSRVQEEAKPLHMLLNEPYAIDVDPLSSF